MVRCSRYAAVLISCLSEKARDVRRPAAITTVRIQVLLHMLQYVVLVNVKWCQVVYFKLYTYMSIGQFIMIQSVFNCLLDYESRSASPSMLLQPWYARTRGIMIWIRAGEAAVQLFIQ